VISASTATPVAPSSGVTETTWGGSRSRLVVPPVVPPVVAPVVEPVVPPVVPPVVAPVVEPVVPPVVIPVVLEDPPSGAQKPEAQTSNRGHSLSSAQTPSDAGGAQAPPRHTSSRAQSSRLEQESEESEPPQATCSTSPSTTSRDHMSR